MTESPPVVIVGAGPTGMTAALDLAHYGIPSLLLDEGTLQEYGSRAIAYHSTALAVWEKLGAAQAMLAKGVAWSRRHTYFHQQEVYTQTFPPPLPDALPSFLNLGQYYVERFLLDQIEAQPLIDLRWNHLVKSLVQSPDTLTLEVQTPSGMRQFSARYLLACDGARSTLRKLLALDFPGRSFDDRFLIADVHASLDLPPEPRFFFNHPAHPGPTVLIHPQPDSVWRIDWQIGAGADVDLERSPARMDARIRAFIGDVPYQIVWLSDYRFHQRLLTRLRHGRVFFLGDAAHLVAPFGARGLNSAVQDVENLAWKLALVLHDKASEALLETYHTERWSAQAENQRVTLNTMKFMAPASRWGKLRRSLILRLTPFLPAARKWVDSGKMSIPFIYRDSLLNLPDLPSDGNWKGAPPLGSKLPDLLLEVWLEGRRTETRLRKLTGSGFLIIYAAPDENEARRYTDRSVSIPDTIPYRIVPVLTGLDFLQPCDVLLLRPDGHLSARRHGLASSEIPDILSHLCHPD